MAMGGRPRSLRVLLARVVLVLFFFSIGFLAAALSGMGSAAMAAATTAEGRRLRQHPAALQLAGIKGRSMAARRDLDLAYVSKRRVPNGADPIHNRRAGKSVRPPGRV